MLQCLEIMLQAHQMMKTEVCSGGEPHMALAGFWACQISQLPYSQWQQTPSLYFLPPNTHLSFYPSFQIAGSLPETKPPNESSIPWLYCRNHSWFLAVFHFVQDMFQAYLWTRETITFPCLMKWQNNRFAYVEAGAVTGLTTLDLKHVKWFISNSCP